MSDLRGKLGFGLSFTIVLLLVVTSVTHAAAIACRSDPLVLLSDGTILDLSASIDASLWDVTDVTYTIHVPVGVHAILAVSTPNWPTALERFSIVSDQPRGVFDTYTVVNTSTGAAVTAQLLVGLRLDTTSGVNGESLRVTISP